MTFSYLIWGPPRFVNRKHRLFKSKTTHSLIIILQTSITFPDIEVNIPDTKYVLIPGNSGVRRTGTEVSASGVRWLPGCKEKSRARYCAAQEEASARLVRKAWGTNFTRAHSRGTSAWSKPLKMAYYTLSKKYWRLLTEFFLKRNADKQLFQPVYGKRIRKLLSCQIYNTPPATDC